MKYADEFRDRAKAEALIAEIRRLLARSDIARQRPLNIMEVCGGHTHSIFRYGIEGMLPPEIELIHGPGCPVCVLPMGRVDDCIAIAERPEVIFTTFGDAMRVPGSRKSLLQARPMLRWVALTYDLGLIAFAIFDAMNSKLPARVRIERHFGGRFAVGAETEVRVEESPTCCRVRFH